MVKVAQFFSTVAAGGLTATSAVAQSIAIDGSSNVSPSLRCCTLELLECSLITSSSNVFPITEMLYLRIINVFHHYLAVLKATSEGK
ncbi:MAG: hypothetical protein AAGA46_07770 [Cyanobacteria bacterium P01_F01_bin.13]